MALTYYRILNQSNSYGAPIKGGLIYEDFNDACDALEEEVRKFDPHFVPFDRDALYKMEDKSSVYHTIGNLHRLSIEEVKVVPKMKQVIYKYSAKSGNLGLMVSKEYCSFDEACDNLDRVLRTMYKNILWQPPMTREKVKEILDNDSSVVYAVYDDGRDTPSTYTLSKY